MEDCARFGAKLAWGNQSEAEAPGIGVVGAWLAICVLGNFPFNGFMHQRFNWWNLSFNGTRHHHQRGATFHALISCTINLTGETFHTIEPCTKNTQVQPSIQ
jgi:hypothetical protein